jgi:pyruvate dehydrogenase E1 component alpha subunit
MAQVVTQSGGVAEDAATARRLYRAMYLVRRFEERTEEQYTRARIGGYCHLCIGEEASHVGAIDQLGEGDYLFASYRDHGSALAVGSDPTAVMAELFGKATGVAGGYGGSMHLLDVKRHFLGGWGIVGGQLPIAVGVALALDYESKPNAVLCQLGEGATNIGAFHESLNLAAIWNLPIVFQVINNRYGMGTSVERASATTELYRHGETFGIPGERVDGMDVLAVRAAGERAVARARSGAGPYILEMQTYRYRGHSMSDPAKYRTREEVDKVRHDQDPIEQVRNRLLAAKMSEQELKAIDAEVRDIVNSAADFAQHDPEPDASELYTDIYR